MPVIFCLISAKKLLRLTAKFLFFFHLMMEEKICKYHISLIRRRWYREGCQNDPNLDISKEPFVFESLQKSNLEEIDLTPVSKTYMEDMLATFPSLPLTSRLERTTIIKKRRYGELAGLSKQVAERASEDLNIYENIKDILLKQLVQLRSIEKIEDPLYIKGKERPRNRRLKGVMEPKGRKVGIKR